MYAQDQHAFNGMYTKLHNCDNIKMQNFPMSLTMTVTPALTVPDAKY